MSYTLVPKANDRIGQSLCWLGRNHQSLHEPGKALEKYLSSLQQCKVNKKSVDYRIVVMLLHTIGETYEDEQINLPDMALKCKWIQLQHAPSVQHGFDERSMSFLLHTNHAPTTGYTEEIHLIETKLDIEDTESVRLVAFARYKAGLLCKARDDLSESIEHLEQGLSSIKQLEGDSHHSTEAMIADTLGTLYAAKQEYNTAKQYFSDSYSLYEKSLGREHVTTAECAVRLAECLEHVGSDLALDFYEESLRVHKLHASEDDETAGNLLFCIGRVQFDKEAFTDAARSFDEVGTCDNYVAQFN
jgi:tetratricopeptide (TPR) repeat protein